MAAAASSWYDSIEEPRILISPSPNDTKEVKDKCIAANDEGQILSLRHPKSDISTSYVYNNGLLQEVHWFKQCYGSWFLGDYVCEDGSLYITTPVDPVFIFLPIFSDARMKKGNNVGVFRQLDEILYVEGYPGYQQLMHVAENSMQVICDVKEVGSTKFFRLDDAKVLSWLRCKVLNLKASLQNLDKNYAIQDEADTLKEIISILSEYLKEEPWLNALCRYYGLNLQDALEKESKSEANACFSDDKLLSMRSLPGKTDCGKSKSSNGKQGKKQKVETNSRNIKDMFRSASKKK